MTQFSAEQVLVFAATVCLSTLTVVFFFIMREALRDFKRWRNHKKIKPRLDEMERRNEKHPPGPIGFFGN